MNKIKCPKCGYEYFPSEIFIPKSFIGTALTSRRDEKGCIEAYDGDEMDLKEDFCCENCLTTFQIEANVEFKTSINPLYDFSSEYVTIL